MRRKARGHSPKSGHLYGVAVDVVLHTSTSRRIGLFTTGDRPNGERVGRSISAAKIDAVLRIASVNPLWRLRTHSADRSVDLAIQAVSYSCCFEYGRCGYRNEIPARWAIDEARGMCQNASRPRKVVLSPLVSSDVSELFSAPILFVRTRGRVVFLVLKRGRETPRRPQKGEAWWPPVLVTRSASVYIRRDVLS